MDKKKKIYKIINICSIIIAFIGINVIAWVILLSESPSNEIIYNLNSSNIKELLPLVAFAYLAAILLYAFEPFGLFTIGYIVYRVVKKRAIKKNAIHPKFDIEYFRDYLGKVSPSYVAYLMDFDIDINRDVPAHLLKLQLDGYIEEQNGKFIVTNKNQVNLPDSDKILLDFVTSNFRNYGILKQYKRAIEQEMLTEKYIKITLNKNGIIKLIVFLIAVPFLVMLIGFLSVSVISATSSIVIEIIIGILMILLIGLFPLVPIIFIIKLITYLKWGGIKRTEKGNELLEQVSGLKKFLEDFTTIDDDTVEKVLLREYYLVYAIVLGVNDTVDDEMLAKIKKQINSDRR